MTQINRRDAIKFSAVSALGGVALGASLPAMRPQSDVAKCIEAHKVAAADLDAAYNKQAELQAELSHSTQRWFECMIKGMPRMRFDLSLHTHESAAKAITAQCANARNMVFALPAQSQKKTVDEINAGQADALQRLDAHYADCDQKAHDCGLTAAEQHSDIAAIAEDKALLALLASYPETPEDAAMKGEYLRSTWWMRETLDGAFDAEPKHIAAMFEGMGCGALS